MQCTFHHCEASAYGGGAAPCSEGNLTFDRCTFAANSAPLGAGLYCQSLNTIIHTLVAFNFPGEGLYTTVPQPLHCCDIYGNEGGDYVGLIADQAGINNNVSADPQFCDASNFDYRLYNTSPCLTLPCVQIGAWPVGCPITSVAEGSPGGFRVVPNPCAGDCRIYFPQERAGASVPRAFLILDAGGRLVRDLRGGAAPLVWNGRDEHGNPVGAGIYFLRYRNGSSEGSHPITVVR